jgi:Tfp pilus assembly protein PilF
MSASNAMVHAGFAGRSVRGRRRCAIAALLLPFACALPAHATPIQEIPITASVPQARLDFEAGQAAFDRGDAQRANVLFKNAVAQDPSFVYAWLNGANASLSAEEFDSALETARRNGAGASE